MWAGLTSTAVVGPYIFPPGGVTRERYLEWMQCWLMSELHRLGIVDSVIFQQDGAPAHYAVQVQNFLFTQFPTWIDGGGTLQWPAGSPDLTTCDNWL